MASDVLMWAGEVRDDLVHQIEIVCGDDETAHSVKTQRALAELRLRLTLIEKLIAVCEETRH